MKGVDDQTMTRWTVVTYPQDFADQGARLGPETMLRLEKVSSVRQDGRYKMAAIVLASGMSPDREEYPKQKAYFEAMMKKWLASSGLFNGCPIYCGHRANIWNCWEMTIRMIEVIKEKKLPRNILVITTGRYIYPRLWLTWTILCRGKPGWRIEFIPEWRGSADTIHELLGTIKYLPLALLKRRKI